MNPYLCYSRGLVQLKVSETKRYLKKNIKLKNIWVETLKSLKLADLLQKSNN
jgi:hypothetical protein